MNDENQIIIDEWFDRAKEYLDKYPGVSGSIAAKKDGFLITWGPLAAEIGYRFEGDARIGWDEGWDEWLADHDEEYQEYLKKHSPSLQDMVDEEEDDGLFDFEREHDYGGDDALEEYEDETGNVARIHQLERELIKLEKELDALQAYRFEGRPWKIVGRQSVGIYRDRNEQLRLAHWYDGVTNASRKRIDRIMRMGTPHWDANHLCTVVTWNWKDKK